MRRASPRPPWLAVATDDRVVAAAVALGLVINLALGLAVGDEHPVRAVTYLVTLLAAAPLTVRSRAPLSALYATAGALILYQALDNPVTPLPICGTLALYSVAARRDRRTLVIVLATLPIVASITSLFFEQQEPERAERALVLAIAGTSVVLGDAVRSRRALSAAYEEQLRLAELNREAVALQRVNDERRRIARDLHDVVAHGISSITVQAGVAAHVLDERPDVAREALDEIRAAGASALNELRATLHVLRDDESSTGEAARAPAPGLHDLDQLLRASAADADLTVTGIDDDALDVDPVVQVVAYRIVQEALTNVAKHAPGADAAVHVAVSADGVRIRVVNATTSTPPDEPTGGFGLVGMRERARSVGGHVEATPRFDGTFEVVADLPRQPAEEGAR